MPNGRPRTQAAQAAARKKNRLEHQGAAVDHHRHRCVQPPLRRSARKRVWRITRGRAPWRTLRERMEQGSALCERRCRTQPALDTLATLRHRLQRLTQGGATLQKRCSPPLEKARTCLDDPLLPSTSKAVERGKRRYRTRQKHVSRARTQEHIAVRLALDMGRAAQGEGRHQTLRTFHETRAG